MQFAQILSAVFGILTTISISCCIAALVLVVPRDHLKDNKNLLKISLFVSTILYHTSRIVSWSVAIYPSMTDLSKYSQFGRDLASFLAYIFIGQTFISFFCLFTIQSFGRQLILKPIESPKYFYIASGIHIGSQIISYILKKSQPLLSDGFMTCFFLLFSIGIILIMSKFPDLCDLVSDNSSQSRMPDFICRKRHHLRSSNRLNDF